VPIERSAGGGGGGIPVVYAPLTDPHTPELIFTDAGDVIMAPDS
jgi:hypothetical protein